MKHESRQVLDDLFHVGSASRSFCGKDQPPGTPGRRAKAAAPVMTMLINTTK